LYYHQNWEQVGSSLKFTAVTSTDLTMVVRTYASPRQQI